MRLWQLLGMVVIGGMVWTAPAAAASSWDIARIDMLPIGGTFELVEKSDSASWSQPRWFAQGRGGLIQLPATSELQEGRCKLKVEADGKLKIWLRGPDIRKNNKTIQLYVEFAELNINGQPQLTEPVKVWHDEPKIIMVPVKAGEEVEITTRFRTLPGGDRK